ncbi:MAG: hypothetical protein IJR59_00300, partial [Firmicutes bacterium]|nr:hypothetical protein [Bacillota bacterium]
VLIFSLTLTGCYNPKLNKENAESLVKEFLEDFRICHYDEMYDLTHDKYQYFKGIYSEKVPTNSYMFGAFSRELSYDIKDVYLTDDEAVVTVHTSNIDAEKILNKIAATYIQACEDDTENNLDKDALLLSTTQYCFDSPDNERVEHDTVFNLIEQDGKWAIESNIMIYDDITGGYMTYYYKNVVMKDLTDEMKGN